MSVLDPLATTRPSPTDRLLTASLLVAPPLFLLVDGLYAARGWDDADAGGAHVLGAIGYAFALLRLTAWGRGRLAAAMLVATVLGTAGNVAYGFNTIQVSLGATDLVDTSGPGAVIKPLGLFFPLALLLGAAVLRQRGRTVAAVLVGLAAVGWPVAHIGNVAWLAVGVNVLLVLGLVPLGAGPLLRPRSAP